MELEKTEIVDQKTIAVCINCYSSDIRSFCYGAYDRFIFFCINCLMYETQIKSINRSAYNKGELRIKSKDNVKSKMINTCEH